MTERERAAQPEDLAQLFVQRANDRDAEGLAELYEPDAVLGFPPGHETVGRAVREGIAKGKELGDFSLDELKRFSPLIDKDVYGALSVEASLRARAVTGGTAPDAVARAIAQARTRIAREPGR